MLDSIRSRLTYANVMATLAVFIALGGSSYAIVNPPRNSVGRAQIKTNGVAASELRRNAVGNGEIRRNAVRSSDVRDNTLDGVDIDESSLGQVPRADTAANAQELGGLTASQLKVKCPSGTRGDAGVCIEEAVRSAETFYSATATCNLRNRRLPSLAELDAFFLDPDIEPASGGELTSDVFESRSQAGQLDVVLIATDAGTAGFQGAVGNPKPFRCASYPIN